MTALALIAISMKGKVIGIQFITNSDLNRPCFAWYHYGKSGLFKTELIKVMHLTWIDQKGKRKYFKCLVF